MSLEQFIAHGSKIRLRALEQMPLVSPYAGLDVESILTQAALPRDCWLTLIFAQAFEGQMEVAIRLASSRFVNNCAQNMDNPAPAFQAYLHACSDGCLDSIGLESKTYQAIRAALDTEQIHYWAGRCLEDTIATPSLEDFRQIQSMHTSSRFATAAVVGALTMTDEPAVLDAIGRFGHHLGTGLLLSELKQQLLDATESAHLTLPFIWLSQTHSEIIPELQALFQQQDIETIKQRMLSLGADTAIQTWIDQERREAENALQELQIPFNSTAKAACLELMDWLTAKELS